MSALWHDNGMPSFLGFKPSFSFYEYPEVHMVVEIACPTYAQAMIEIREREELFGAVWFLHNAYLAHKFHQNKRPWWL